MRRTFKENSDLVSLGVLECLMVGGFWFPDRIREHLGEEVACPLGCGEYGVGPLHILWTCPCIADVYHDKQAVIKTQCHGLEAAASEHLQCLWLRGLMPDRVLTEQITSNPPDFALAHFVGDYLEGPLEGGEYHTDASGGKHGSDSLLRRCGCGFAFLNQSDDLVFGAYFVLPGEKQSVPRGGVVCSICASVLG